MGLFNLFRRKKNSEAVPAAEEVVSKAEETVSAAEEAASNVEEIVPEVEETISTVEEAVSDVEETVSTVEEVVSDAEETVPNAEEAVSNVEEAISNVDEVASEVEETVLNAEEAVSNVEEAVSNVDEVVSEVEEAVSTVEEAASNVEETVSNVEESAPDAEEIAVENGSADAEPEKAAEADDSEILYDTEVLEADAIHQLPTNPKFRDLNLSDFWHDTKESERRHISQVPDTRLLREVEDALGYSLPVSYVELMSMHNGGLVNKGWYPMNVPPKSTADYIQITDILGIGREAPYSLMGRFGSDYLVESWRHNPNIGVAICNTMKPGRALVFLDYRDCGPWGEPKITYSDVETGVERTLAPNFEMFIRHLCSTDEMLQTIGK